MAGGIQKLGGVVFFGVLLMVAFFIYYAIEQPLVLIGIAFFLIVSLIAIGYQDQAVLALAGALFIVLIGLSYGWWSNYNALNDVAGRLAYTEVARKCRNHLRRSNKPNPFQRAAHARFHHVIERGAAGEPYWYEFWRPMWQERQLRVSVSLLVPNSKGYLVPGCTVSLITGRVEGYP
ncbi:MAG: hypothetical protein AAGC70_09520 [Pseudomonadota bacterium]